MLKVRRVIMIDVLYIALCLFAVCLFSTISKYMEKDQMQTVLFLFTMLNFPRKPPLSIDSTSFLKMCCLKSTTK